MLVKAFGRIVARLIEAVDRALVGDHVGIGNTSAPHKVFLEPQPAVVAVVRRDGVGQSIRGRCRPTRLGEEMR